MKQYYQAILIILLIAIPHILPAQVSKTDPLQFGAEIFIEPGQSDEDVESWFRTLSDNNMHLTRIRMFENYMKDANGNWDFSLFDKAFEFAAKYNVKIYANLFPATGFTDVGGFKFPYNREHLQRVAEYTGAVVTHYKNNKALYGWVPINEPGGGNIHDPLAKEIFTEWKSKQTDSIADPLTDVHHFSFDGPKFLLYYNTWYLNWLSEEIRKYDPVNPIHVNTHQIFENVAQYDFPAWGKFLTSLGGSAHASWHFGYFTRENYALAMSANSEIIRSGAGDIPWLMTELQGGNNIYSGYAPFCPTREEIAQWLWVSVATGGKGAIFWCLNPRMSGTEAGEWAMLDFQNQPTSRLTEAGKVAETVKKHQDLFRVAKPLNSKIHILYNRESLWVEERMVPDFESVFDIRKHGASMKSAISYFEAFSQMGLQPTFNEFREFNFEGEDFTRQTIVLAHQIALSEVEQAKLRHFVTNGGTLLVDGLTGFYNEDAVSVMVNEFPLKDLFGGSVSQYFFEKDFFNLELNNGQTLKSHALKAKVVANGGEKITDNQGNTIGTINNYGKGKVVWLPSPIGLGARKSGDYKPLLDFVLPFLDISDELRFGEYHKGVFMKNLKSGDQLVTVVVNKSGSTCNLRLNGFPENKNPRILYSNKNSKIDKYKLTIDNEDSFVILWE
ncbi:MAG: beta-galactosidase [Draconibacterium sp.]